MANNFKTVPNQKVVSISKAACNDAARENYYAKINLQAMGAAAQALEAGAFKLWVYFAKNQNGYQFALSSKEVEASFGMKIKQYNNAVDQLIEKGYLVRGEGNYYTFCEIPVNTKEDNEKCLIPKGNNEVITKKDNGVITKSNNELLPQGIRNITNTTQNITKDITEEKLLQPAAANSFSIDGQEGTVTNPIIVSREWMQQEYKSKPQNWKALAAIGQVYHAPTMRYYKVQ